MRRTLLMLPLLLAPGAARAWDVQVSEVGNRVAELAQAWSKKGQKELLADKLKRSQQSKKPDWINKSSWFAKVGDKVYSFGVGLSDDMRYKDIELSVAENRALAEVKASGRVAEIIDWYWDREEDTLYALAVEVPPALPPQ